jgi:hypothetical protein
MGQLSTFTPNNHDIGTAVLLDFLTAVFTRSAAVRAARSGILYIYSAAAGYVVLNVAINWRRRAPSGISDQASSTLTRCMGTDYRGRNVRSSRPAAVLLVPAGHAERDRATCVRP